MIDAEGLMPLDTSDFHNTICLEMRMMKTLNMLSICNNSNNTKPEQLAANKLSFSSIDTPLQNTSAVNLANNVHSSNNGDLASVDSSSYASCQQFLSQGDLTQENVDDRMLDMLDSTLYINPFEKGSQPSSGTLVRGSSLYSGVIGAAEVYSSQVKKSASGDTALRSLAASPMDDGFGNTNLERGSHISLNEMVPKHRKTRFQQQQVSFLCVFYFFIIILWKAFKSTFCSNLIKLFILIN